MLTINVLKSILIKGKNNKNYKTEVKSAKRNTRHTLKLMVIIGKIKPKDKISGCDIYFKAGSVVEVVRRGLQCRHECWCFFTKREIVEHNEINGA